jgi:hypothetical protein
VARAQASAFPGLFCCGLWVTLFGSAPPFIADETAVGLGTAGFVLTAVAAGSISASAVVSLRLEERRRWLRRERDRWPVIPRRGGYRPRLPARGHGGAVPQAFR